MPSQRRRVTGSADAAAAQATAAGGPRILKKYPNRRLYDTHGSSYVTLADVKRMVLAGDDFEVRDAKTGDDLTRSILLQIILEEESGGLPMFSTTMLSQIIRFYGHSMQGLMGEYMEKNLHSFVELQQRMLAGGLPDAKALSPETWTQFMGGNAPLMQAWSSTYLEQLREMFDKMQGSGALFPGFPTPRR